MPNTERQNREGYRRYKKGWEVRLTAAKEAEVETLQRMSVRLNYTPGAAFKKGRKFVVPVYGRTAVRAFQRAHSRPSQAASGPD